MQDRKRLEESLADDSRIAALTSDLDTLFELAREGEDVNGDIARELKSFSAVLEKVETAMLLSGENDARSAIVTIHPGAGGTESQDWAEMLLRMYMRFAESRGWKSELIDRQDGEEAGLKSATLHMVGDHAYGYLRSEMGVHRLVRISPFDAAKRRHTSFASVYVSPEIDDDIQIDIADKDLRVDTYRSSGAGGQHVNVTDSAVRITHLPTGIVVTCQNERSQGRNREMAMRVLRARLYQKALEERRSVEEKRAGEKKSIEWGSQIRSYVLHPYQMVKDHRTGHETGDTAKVLDGGLSPFIEAYLKNAVESVR
jgi:peptide chain release factor 2